MTNGPAKKTGLKNRGLVKEGYWADLVLINPDKINDRATFKNPYQYPDGVKYVMVNGKIAVDGGAYTGEKAGEILKRT